jgi:hypothetical protein
MTRPPSTEQLSLKLFEVRFTKNVSDRFSKLTSVLSDFELHQLEYSVRMELDELFILSDGDIATYMERNDSSSQT